MCNISILQQNYWALFYRPMLNVHIKLDWLEVKYIIVTATIQIVTTTINNSCVKKVVWDMYI